MKERAQNATNPPPLRSSTYPRQSRRVTTPISAPIRVSIPRGIIGPIGYTSVPVSVSAMPVAWVGVRLKTLPVFVPSTTTAWIRGSTVSRGLRSLHIRGPIPVPSIVVYSGRASWNVMIHRRLLIASIPVVAIILARVRIPWATAVSGLGRIIPVLVFALVLVCPCSSSAVVAWRKIIVFPIHVSAIIFVCPRVSSAAAAWGRTKVLLIFVTRIIVARVRASSAIAVRGVFRIMPIPLFVIIFVCVRVSRRFTVWWRRILFISFTASGSCITILVRDTNSARLKNGRLKILTKYSRSIVFRVDSHFSIGGSRDRPGFCADICIVSIPEEHNSSNARPETRQSVFSYLRLPANS